MPYLISIRPRYVREILTGNKTVELRRRFAPREPVGAPLFIYETAPSMSLVGFCVIDAVEELPLGKLWSVAKAKGSIQKLDFEAYFTGRSSGIAIHLSGVTRFAEPISRSEMIAKCGLTPPQSYRLLSYETVSKLIGSSAGQVSTRYEHSDPGRGSEADPRHLRVVAA